MQWKQEQSEREVDGQLRVYRWQRKDGMTRASEYTTVEVCDGTLICFSEDAGGTKSSIEISLTPDVIAYLRKVVE